jgi:hypothetical protein
MKACAVMPAARVQIPQLDELRTLFRARIKKLRKRLAPYRRLEPNP